jgi:ABC-2 type transport system ATP-binding protein
MMAHDAYVVEVQGLVKEFDGIRAVDGLDLGIRKGEVYGLLGPNGAGKTTVIRILIGLSRATSGKARVLDSPAGDKALAARVGYMPQELSLYEMLTVDENLDLFAELYEMSKDRIAQRKAQVLEFVALGERRGSLVYTLSGGMRHRVSLAVALLHEPELLLLDEPTVGVDPELRAGFWDNFGTLKNAGKTVVITTHYMDEARHCDRIGLMHRGRLVAEGPPEDVVRRAGARDLEEAFLKLASRTAKGEGKGAGTAKGAVQ